jgi:hypothetical protein
MNHDEKKRLATQTDEIIARLKAGPATNWQLAAISLKYTSRVSDARKLGYQIICERSSATKGLTTYSLKATPAQRPQEALTNLPLFKT